MKVNVSDLNERELHNLMREEGIPYGVLKTIGPLTWLEYDKVKQ